MNNSAVLKQQRYAHSYPHPAEHGVEGGGEETLYSKILFDPLEEELYLPALLADIGDRSGAPVHGADQENIDLAGLSVSIPYAP